MSSSGQLETNRTHPIAVFMAFGTKGDVYPLAAISAAFAADMKHYSVFFISHSAHQNLSSHLAKENITYVPISSPPALSFHEDNGNAEETFLSLQRKKSITSKHRQECISAVETIFGCATVMKGDFIEGWSLAELFQVQCIVAAPYVVPYSAPTSFESQFRKEFPLLYKYLLEARSDKVCWKDVIHWMWPLFTENWGSWRNDVLNLSPVPFTDPVTGLPTWHERAPSPLLLYGFSEEVVECPDYWPSNVHVCGFWFLPNEWQYSCLTCCEAVGLQETEFSTALEPTCPSHTQLETFLKTNASQPLVFVGLSSIGSMGFVSNPRAFLLVLQTIARMTDYRFLLFTAGYEPLETAVLAAATEEPSSLGQREFFEDQILLFYGRLFCFCGSIPYQWLFKKCAAAVHHGGSGSTAAALHAGIPQVICPFMLDQFYWAERMFWLGVAPEPLKRCHLVPDDRDMCIKESVDMLSRSLSHALSDEVKARASDISLRISLQDGVAEAVKILKKEIAKRS